MRVLYDASSMLGHSGIERYSRELIRSLLRQRSEVEPVLLSTFRRQSDVAALFQGTRSPEVIPSLPNRLMLGQHLQFITRKLKSRAMERASVSSDLTHVLAPLDDPRTLKRFVVTIHDLFPIDNAFSFDGTMEAMFSRSIEWYIHRSRRIIVLSSYVASTILERYPTVADKIRIIPGAASDHFCRVPLDEAAIRSMNVSTERPPVIFVGRVDERKNIPMILKAYARVSASVREKHPLVLVLSGTTTDISRFTAHYAQQIKDASAQILVAIPTSALVQLMNIAQCMVFPSKAEGFGLPVLEAMQCGCAVITSDRSSLPEVAADAAILVDPTSSESIATAIEELCTKQAVHASYVEAGLRRAAQFTWDRTAERTAEVYREACEG